MQKCKYNGNAIYAFNILGKNDTINFQLEKQWKKSGENNQLSCDECGAPVIFRCGKINIPHFSHKSDFQSGNKCKYSTETEEHIAGKKLLLNYMLSLYPDAKGEIRYILPERKIADLYFRFSNGQELVIEFQRLGMNATYWDEKRDFYKKLGINNLWFVSERTENIDDLIREIKLSFSNRMILNDSKNRIIFLAVETEEVTIVSKIVIKNNDTNEIIYDELFKKMYPLSNIIILPDGTIDCDFKENFKENKIRLEQKYSEEKRMKEEAEIAKNRKKIELEKFKLEGKKRLRTLKEQEQEKETPWSEIGYHTNNYYKDNYKTAPSKNYPNFVKDERYYRNKINKAINGDTYAMNALAKNLIYGCSDDYTIIKRIFQERIDIGDNRAENIMNEVMRQAHL